MPRMTQTRKIATDAVQGEGSWVKATSPRVREVRQCAVEGQEYEAALKLLTTHIVEWNWTDESGKALPIPGEDADVLGDMTQDEVIFLLQEINSVRGAVSKNLS